MGHFLFQSIFYLSVIFKMLPLSIFIQFLQLQEVQALWSSMTTVAVKVKSSFRYVGGSHCQIDERAKLIFRVDVTGGYRKLGRKISKVYV